MRVPYRRINHNKLFGKETKYLEFRVIDIRSKNKFILLCLSTGDTIYLTTNKVEQQELLTLNNEVILKRILTTKDLVDNYSINIYQSSTLEVVGNENNGYVRKYRKWTKGSQTQQHIVFPNEFSILYFIVVRAGNGYKILKQIGVDNAIKVSTKTRQQRKIDLGSRVNVTRFKKTTRTWAIDFAPYDRSILTPKQEYEYWKKLYG